MRLTFRVRWVPQKHDLDFSKPYRDTGEPIINASLQIPNALIYTGARMYNRLTRTAELYTI